MGLVTTNISLYKPDIGETGWGSKVNDNFDTIDVRFYEGVIALLSSTPSVDLNGAPTTETALYTVPTGKVLVVDHIIMRAFSGNCTTAVVTFGKTGGTCDEFLGDQTLTNASGTGDYLIVSPVPNATPPKVEFFTAAQVFAVEITTAEGGVLTCTIDVFGYLYTA